MSDKNEHEASPHLTNDEQMNVDPSQGLLPSRSA